MFPFFIIHDVVKYFILLYFLKKILSNLFNNYKINNLQKHNSAVRIYYSLQIMRETIFFFEDLCDLRNILKSPIARNLKREKIEW